MHHYLSLCLNYIVRVSFEKGKKTGKYEFGQLFIRSTVTVNRYGNK